MKRLFFLQLLFLFCCLHIQAQRNTGTWDRQMQLTECSIKIQADAFTASTFIEMEFCNNSSTELEGLYQFSLQPGQVITAFQLMLDGKYRNGSIEEKWKATNAYNTIVGKRVDPALLTNDWGDNYSLRIYPVPAKGCRKVTMTIQQQLRLSNGWLNYSLPLNIAQKVKKLVVDIHVVSNEAAPVCKEGLIKTQRFTNGYSPYHLQWKAEEVMMDRPLSFSIPLTLQQPQLCIKPFQGKTYFALRMMPHVAKEYAIEPKSLTVFWDVSASQQNRNIPKEISFLKQYVSRYNVQQMTIVTFNYRTQDTAIFRNLQQNQKRWERYLEDQEYDGATQLGCLNISNVQADVALLFSDGNNTWGSAAPKTGSVLLFAVHAGGKTNEAVLNNISFAGGGRLLDLDKLTINDAVTKAGTAQNRIMNIYSATGKTVLNNRFNPWVDSAQLLSGSTTAMNDSLVLVYGNNGRIYKIEKIYIGSGSACNGIATERMYMFNMLDSLRKGYDWNAMIDFGLQEKVVTQQTAYIVLEKIEDYIKYNIEAPSDLKQECEQRGYVRKDTRTQRYQQVQQNQLYGFNNLVAYYNNRIRWYDDKAPLIQLQLQDIAAMKIVASNGATGNTVSFDMMLQGRVPGIDVNNAMLEDVVVTGYGAQRKSSLTGSSSRIIANEIGYYPYTSQALQGKVAGVYVSNNVNDARIMIRGMSSINGKSQPLIVLDGVPTDMPLNDINPNDIDHITILKDASATALYGSRGSNGVIVITTKKGKSLGDAYTRWLRYRLKNQEDIDYMQEIKGTDKRYKYQRYLELKAAEHRDAGFYFDMAQHLFDNGYRNEAIVVLSNAAEEAQGNATTLRAVAFVLESWKCFDEAITMYKNLLPSSYGNLDIVRDLAWAYYQNANYQDAVNTLYTAATTTEKNYGYYYNDYQRAMLLEDMNAIIGMHKDILDVSNIPEALIRPLPVDLRILVENNTGQMGNVQIKEPGGEVCDWYHPTTKTGGSFGGGYYYYGTTRDYTVKQAKPGTYKITAAHYDRGTNGKIPSFIRIMTFRSFGMKGQEITIENIIMDNQAGEVEIGEVKY